MNRADRAIRQAVQHAALATVLVFTTAWALWALGKDKPTVRGTVVDSHGRPVAGAVVRWRGTRLTARTDGAGRFRLPLPPQDRSGLWIAAAAPGFYNAGVRPSRFPVTLRLRPLPPPAQRDYRWVDPSPEASHPHACGRCHVELYREWAASGHATSVSNRWFVGLLYGTGTGANSPVPNQWTFAADLPELTAVCAPCHVPQAALNDPAMVDPRRVIGTAREGIHCDLCHKVTGVDVDRLPLQHGVHAYQFVTPPAGQQVFLGPLPDAISEGDAYSPVYRDARYCAPCHEGLLLGVHVYRTFSEWERSPAAQRGITCQDCHMPPPTERTNTAPGHGGVDRPRNQLAVHRFPGGDHPETLARALQLEKLVVTRLRERLEVNVTVRAGEVGHRVPTGFPQRHFILTVEARADDGTVLRCLGGPRLPGALTAYELPGTRAEPMVGMFFGRLLLKDSQLAPFWKSHREVDRTLGPGEARSGRFLFALDGHATGTVRVTLLYRRFYPIVLRQKGWPDQERTVWQHETKW